MCDSKEYVIDILAQCMDDDRIDSETIGLFNSVSDLFTEMKVLSPIECANKPEICHLFLANYLENIRKSIEDDDLPEETIAKMENNIYVRYLKHLCKKYKSHKP
jgi:hypothetical protein